MNTVTNGACPLAGHQCDKLILDRLDTALDFFSDTRLCDLVDDCLIQ